MLCNHNVLCRVDAVRTAGLHLCSWARALSQIPRGRLGRCHVLPSGSLGGSEGTTRVHPSRARRPRSLHLPVQVSSVSQAT